jgi:ubiquinol-cytochrome c reductase cytochrome b subunit
VIVIYAVLGVLTYQGVASPWSPHMTAWSGDLVPENIIQRSTPAQLQGALVFQNKNCRNCHALEGSGGQRGPDLTTVGTRLTRNQLIDQVSNGTPGGIKQGNPGGGNMPAYGKQINPSEMTVLAEFLESLRPPEQPAPEPAFQRTNEKQYP